MCIRDSAIPHYDRTLAASPKDTGALFDLANCHEKMGNPDAAVDAYQRYIKAIEAKDGEAANRAKRRIEAIRRGSL